MFKCNYCGRLCKRKHTSNTYVCEQKRRFMQEKEKHVQLGFIHAIIL